MNAIWLVAQHEFITNIKRPSFLYAVFGAPLFMIVLIGIVLLVTIASEESNTVESLGYVDAAQVLTADVELPDYFVAYADAAAARAALEDAQAIDAYFVITQTYQANGRVEFYGNGSMPNEVEDDIELVLGRAVASTIASDLSTEFLRDPVDTIIFLEDTGRELNGVTAFLGLFIVPVIFSFVFVMALQLTSGFLMSGIVEEKTNRIIEVLITSIRPIELLTGKLFGLGALGLVQLVVWAVLGGLAFVVFGNTELLQSIQFPLDLIALAFLYFVLTYFLYASVLAGVGAVVDGEQESRQVAGILSLLAVVPFFVIIQFMTDADGTIPTILSLVPFTSGTAMILRSAFGSVPPEQFLLSIGILLASGVFIVWASAKIFRWALLLYGQSVSFKTLLRVLRGRPDMGVIAEADTGKGRAERNNQHQMGAEA